MTTQIIFKNVMTQTGRITIKAVINTVDDLLYMLKVCYLKHGISLNFIKDFLLNHFPQLILKFLDNLIKEFKKTLISWLSNFLKLFS